MNRPALLTVLLVLVVLAGAWLRLADLGNRPMHHDEAVQAVKFGALLERGRYVYDPSEYHGPALNYLSLPLVRLAGARTLARTSEADLRLLPALCGIGLIAMVWLVRDGLGRAGALCAMALTTFSPMLVFYSRDYIAETLLVLFSFGAIAGGWRYLRGMSPWRAGWLALAGVSVGMMHASKETFVIALFAMAVAVALTLAWNGRGLRVPIVRNLPALGAGLAVGAVVSVLLFSSFFTNPRGPLDSLATYLGYLGRASGHGDAAAHVHPPWYYAGVLLWQGGAAWTQAPTVVLALVGFAAGATGRGLGRANASLVRFLGIYALVMLAVYSAFPYKTPWCALGALHAMILLAGVGAAALVGEARGRAARAAAVGLIALAFGFTAWQAWRGSFVAYADPRNPSAYVQTTDDVPALAHAVRQVAGARPVQVICPDNDYWPLPWYLRDLPRVGWLAQVPEGPLAPVLIVKPEVGPALADKLFAGGGGRLYVPLTRTDGGRDWLLRPNVPLRAYVRLDVWEERRP